MGAGGQPAFRAQRAYPVRSRPPCDHDRALCLRPPPGLHLRHHSDFRHRACAGLTLGPVACRAVCRRVSYPHHSGGRNLAARTTWLRRVRSTCTLQMDSRNLVAFGAAFYGQFGSRLRRWNDHGIHEVNAAIVTASPRRNLEPSACTSSQYIYPPIALKTVTSNTTVIHHTRKALRYFDIGSAARGAGGRGEDGWPSFGGLSSGAS